MQGMTYWIKFKCPLVKYTNLPTQRLKFDYGLNVNFFKGVGKIGDMECRFAGREKEVSYAQAEAIVEHISKYGFNSLD